MWEANALAKAEPPETTKKIKSCENGNPLFKLCHSVKGKRAVSDGSVVNLEIKVLGKSILNSCQLGRDFQGTFGNKVSVTWLNGMLTK